MPFACIFVPDFSVEALLRAEPELRSQAVAVLEGKAPLQKVFAGNEKARRAGVEVRQRIAQSRPADRLVRHQDGEAARLSGAFGGGRAVRETVGRPGAVEKIFQPRADVDRFSPDLQITDILWLSEGRSQA